MFNLIHGGLREFSIYTVEKNVPIKTNAKY